MSHFLGWWYAETGVFLLRRDNRIVAFYAITLFCGAHCFLYYSVFVLCVFEVQIGDKKNVLVSALGRGRGNCSWADSIYSIWEVAENRFFSGMENQYFKAGRWYQTQSCSRPWTTQQHKSACVLSSLFKWSTFALARMCWVGEFMNSFSTRIVRLIN